MNGFTLLEVLVALGITVLLTAGMYTAYTSNLEAIEQVRDQEVVYQTARVVLDRMVRELESAMTDATSGVTAEGLLGLVGVSGETAGRPADRVDFTTSSHLAWQESSPETELCEVGYRLEPDEDTGVVTLFRRQQDLPDADLEAGGEEIDLSEDVTALEIRYEDEDGNELDTWDSRSEEQEGRLPRTIRLRLTVQGISGREAAFSTRVHPVLSPEEKTE
ncbi:MAG: type II secretion system protein GspJ [Desulfobacteraceae bacterium]